MLLWFITSYITIAALTEAVREEMLRRTPIGRLGEPKDVVAAVEFLASEEAGFVNGARIDVNGGFVVG